MHEKKTVRRSSEAERGDRWDANARRAEIVRVVQQSGEGINDDVLVARVALVSGVSAETVRKDLAVLEHVGVIKGPRVFPLATGRRMTMGGKRELDEFVREVKRASER